MDNTIRDDILLLIILYYYSLDDIEYEQCIVFILYAMILLQWHIP